VEFLSNFGMSSPLNKRKAFLFKSFLATVLLSSTVGKHEAQLHAKGNFSIWKSRAQFWFPQ